MCYPTDYTYAELRALLSDAIATANRTSGHLDDALHALTPSLAPAAVSPGSASTPVPAGAGDPDNGATDA